MDQSNLYIPNPQKWIKYLSKRGLSIPSQKTEDSCVVNINAISPAQQTVDQAKSELKRENINMSNTSSLSHNKVDRQRTKIS